MDFKNERLRSCVLLIREFINTLLEADGFQLFLTQYRELCFLVFIVRLVNLLARGLTIVPRIKYR